MKGDVGGFVDAVDWEYEVVSVRSNTDSWLRLRKASEDRQRLLPAARLSLHCAAENYLFVASWSSNKMIGLVWTPLYHLVLYVTVRDHVDAIGA